MAEQIVKGIVAKIPEGYYKPSGKKIIRTTEELNVRDYATAQVYEPNLIPENIAKDVKVLGVVGTHEGGAGGIIPSGTIDITENGTYDVTSYEKVNVAVAGSGESTLKKMIQQMGTAEKLFIYNEYITDLTDILNYNDTQGIENAYEMFYGCIKLQTIPEFATSSIKNMKHMFYGCKKLVEAPFVDMQNATDTSEMFAECREIEKVNLSYECKSTTAERMFSYCYKLKEAPLFDTSNITTMSYMFDRCYLFTTIPLYNTSNITNFSGMMLYCNKLVEFPAINTSKAETMKSMFNGCTALESLPTLDMSKVTDMSSFLNGCSNFSQDLILDVPNCKTYQSVCYKCPKIEKVVLKNTSLVTNFNAAFNSCSKLYCVDIDTYNISSSSNTLSVGNCYSLKALVIRNFGTNYVIGTSTFSNCYHILGTTNTAYNPNGLKDGYIYVPRNMIETLSTATNWSTHASQLRALEDYTLDGTTTGELDLAKMGLE